MLEIFWYSFRECAVLNKHATSNGPSGEAEGWNDQTGKQNKRSGVGENLEKAVVTRILSFSLKRGLGSLYYESTLPICRRLFK